MYRIGQSRDRHQLVDGRKLIIGGVEIDHKTGLLGHSDADVLLHAISEAIIGALGLGDLGEIFPDNDPQYRGISSLKILNHTHRLMVEQGYCIVNLDSTIHAERPKMKPHVPLMRENVAGILRVPIEDVNIKATRGERMGFIGREEGIEAECVVLLKKVDI